MFIEFARLKLKPEGSADFAAAFPRLREIFMSLEGAAEARLLQNNADASSIAICFMWSSKKGLDLFRADQRHKDWVKGIVPLIDHEVGTDYYDEIAN